MIVGDAHGGVTYSGIVHAVKSISRYPNHRTVFWWCGNFTANARLIYDQPVSEVSCLRCLDTLNRRWKRQSRKLGLRSPTDLPLLLDALDAIEVMASVQNP